MKSHWLCTLSLVLTAVLSLASAANVSAEEPSKPAAGRPNILVIVADDMGFSDIGCYGGEISTPHLDQLAAGGLRFTQFYNTARCWPTRSAILTGYYPQQIHMDPPQGRLPPWTRVLPHYLQPLGYRCYHSGKWHLFGAPNVVADGGFNHSYKLDDHDRYFYPKRHTKDDKPLPPVKRDSGYYSTTAIADYAIECLKEHADKHAAEPFFQYLAFTSPHFPVQALPEDIARYRQKYTAGWDAVRQARWERLKKAGIVDCALSPMAPAFTPRYWKDSVLKDLGPGEVEHPVAWDSLTDEQKNFQASKMAVHAAMVDRMDQEIGRVLDQVRAMKAFENTIIFFLSDNGADATILIRGDKNDRAAAPGSGGSFLCIGPGWASASNSPFRLHKIWVHEGGISTPLIVHWPQGIAARGELRHGVGHVIDFVPTILELAGGKANGQWHGVESPPLPGKSLVPAFANDNPIGHDNLFFKHEGNRALRMGNWKLVSSQENGNAWELYDLSTDRCEQVDLAKRQPERAKTMIDKWQLLDAKYRRDAGAK
ncbi:MAG: arylsulfatase [Planctomycetia bacterium]|nr:arylsulfatase [Planctomycetia bacterium]